MQKLKCVRVGESVYYNRRHQWFCITLTLHCRLCPEHCGSNINIVTQRGCSDHYSSHAQWCPHRTPCNRGQMFHTGYHAYLFRLLPSLPALSSQMFVLLNITATWFLVVTIVNSVSKMNFSPLFSQVKSFFFTVFVLTSVKNY